MKSLNKKHHHSQKTEEINLVDDKFFDMVEKILHEKLIQTEY